jgi:hypothetical protein
MNRGLLATAAHGLTGTSSATAPSPTSRSAWVNSAADTPPATRPHISPTASDAIITAKPGNIDRVPLIANPPPGRASSTVPIPRTP